MVAKLLPDRLRPGDRVGIVTPSWPVSMSPSPDPLVEFHRGIKQLEELGFEPVISQHALSETGYMAGSPEERAADINAMFRDPNVKAIISSHGGYVASGVLPHLDWEAIAANPTILMGFSNAVTLLHAIHAVTGMVTFHGPMVMYNLGQAPSQYELDEFAAMLSDGRIGAIRQREPWTTLRAGEPAEGTLIGDALGLRASAGTRYQIPIGDDVILFVEGMVDENGLTDSLLRQLVYMGIFEHVRGVLVGSDGASFTGEEPSESFAEILMRVTPDYDFPIVKCDDFGHGGVNTVLPIGVEARLDPSAAQLEITETFVL